MKSSTSTFIIIFIVILIAGGVAGAVLATNSKKTSTTTVSNGFFTAYIVGTGSDGAGPYQTQIKEALSKVSSYITFNDTVPITFRGFQESSSTLARASMANSNDITAGGTVEINTLKGAPNAGWDDVLVHEIMHVLGLPAGNKWQNAIIITGGQYFLDKNDFPNAAAAYLEWKGVDGNIPLSNGGSHWDEATFGTEVLTPAIGLETSLAVTKLTLGALKDIGWNVDLTKADPFP